MNRFDVAFRGVRFVGVSRQRFIVRVRYGSAARTNPLEWHGMQTVAMIATALRWFARAVERHQGSDVYCIDTVRNEVVAFAHRGEVMLDKIDPLHVYDAISSDD